MPSTTGASGPNCPPNPPHSSIALVRKSSELTRQKRLTKQIEANQQSPLDKREIIEREHSQRVQPLLSTHKTATDIHTMTPAQRAALDGGRWWKADDSPEKTAWRMSFETPEFAQFESTMGGRPSGKDVNAFFHIVRETEERVKGLEVGKGVSDDMEMLSERLRKSQQTVEKLEPEMKRLQR